MRHRIVIAAVAALVMGAAALAPAQEHDGCSLGRAAGDWGYTKTGTLVLPTGAVPFASVGRFTIDGAGNLTGTNDGSVGGRVSKDVLQGTLEVSADCTGTMTVGVYDTSGNLLRTLVMGIVFVDDGAAARGIVTSLVLPSGASLPSTITADARKIVSFHVPRPVR